MGAGEIHEDDIGTIFEAEFLDAGAVLDISGATTKELLFRKPDGTKVAEAGLFTTDGTDGKLRYTTIADFLDASGRWSVQGRVVLPAGTWSSDITAFHVYPNL